MQNCISKFKFFLLKCSDFFFLNVNKNIKTHFDGESENKIPVVIAYRYVYERDDLS